MPRLRIKTCQEFRKSLEEVLSRHRDPTRSPLDSDPHLQEYGSWHALGAEVQNNIDSAEWGRLRDLLELYDAVERVGKKSEMFETSWVAFLSHIRLPKDPAALRSLRQNSPPAFEAAIKKDRGIV